MRNRLTIPFTLILLGLFGCNEFPETPQEQRLYLEQEGEQVAHFYSVADEPNRLYIKGVIYGNTHSDLLVELSTHPNVDTLVMVEVPGSIDDEVNLKASTLIRERKLNTFIPENGWVASGGTDMFLAGIERSAHPSAKFGVHAWASGDDSANDFPKDDEVHQSYLHYYRQMGIPESFYWYTLDAAPVDDIHWMTSAEISHYQILTSK